MRKIVPYFEVMRLVPDLPKVPHVPIIKALLAAHKPVLIAIGSKHLK